MATPIDVIDEAAENWPEVYKEEADEPTLSVTEEIGAVDVSATVRRTGGRGAEKYVL